MSFLERDFNSALQLDAPLTKGPAPRWQRKALEVSHNNSSINTSLNATLTQNTSKTPSKSPSRNAGNGKQTTPGRNNNKTPKTPNASGTTGDRFIPNRSAMQFEVANYLLKQNENEENEDSPNTVEYKKTMRENLHGDLSSFRILSYQNKAPQAPEGYVNNLKVVYTSSKTPASSRKANRYIPQTPEKILDAPEIIDDYYLNLIDWSSTNLLAVALAGHVYIWNATTGDIQQLLEMEETGEYVCSVSWTSYGKHLAIGTSTSEVQLWDVEASKRLRVLKGHSGRVPSLAWRNYLLSSGSRSGFIHNHDVRQQQHHVGTFAGHSQEVCGLRWSPDERYLASGANDNILNIWNPVMSLNHADNPPQYTFMDHQAAVKAVAWCPWQPSILATGGGTADRNIRLWNCNLGVCVQAIDTKSQVCSILWSQTYKELISGHGFANNELNIWKYPNLNKVAELTGHTARVLNMAMSPDGTTVVSAGADETLRLWTCFATDEKKKKAMATKTKKDEATKLLLSIR